MNPVQMLAAAAGGSVLLGAFLFITGFKPSEPASPTPATPSPRWRSRIRAARAAAVTPGTTRRQMQLRLVTWSAAGLTTWLITGWPVVAVALLVVGVWLPWLLGGARVAQEHIGRLEAVESWCRRMADTLVGGGAVGLAQTISTTAQHVDEPVGTAARQLARRLRDGDDARPALREFADAVDDRVGDTVAAALLLALRQQSVGVASVLRQLADGVARDVRARREIEAERAESRQSIRMLLLIQAGMLVLLALVPGFAAPYRTTTGQVVMAILLTGTVLLMIWMRRLALGQRPPRFLGTAVRNR
jgi:tight adherence protein B